MFSGKTIVIGKSWKAMDFQWGEAPDASWCIRARGIRDAYNELNGFKKGQR